MVKKVHINWVIVLLVCMVLILQNASFGQKKKTTDSKAGSTQNKSSKRILYGQASYYAAKFEGRKTATGEIFRHSKYTAACNQLPLGTWIKVTNLKNGRSIVVRTNDRLHSKTTRIVDLSRTGAQKLGYIKSGLTRVKIEVLDEKPK